MKQKFSLLFLAVALSLPAQALAAANPGPNPEQQNLEQQVKISKLAARQLALERVPQGNVKSEKLEQRGDRQVWVLEIGRYQEPTHVTTVMVDAETGAVQSGTPHPAKKG